MVSALPCQGRVYRFKFGRGRGANELPLRGCSIKSELNSDELKFKIWCALEDVWQHCARILLV